MSFRACQIERLQDLGGVHCWGFGSGGLDGADAAGAFGGSSGVGNRGGGGGGDRSGYAPSSFDDRRGRTSRDGVSSGNGGIGRDSSNAGAATRAKVDVALSVASLVNPVAAFLGYLGVEAYGWAKGKSAESFSEKGYAKGFRNGPEMTALESVAKAGLSIGPMVGLSPQVAALANHALTMEVAARTNPGTSTGTGFSTDAGNDNSLGAWTDQDSVKSVLERANIAADDQQVDALVKDYNARKGVISRKSHAITTKAERYDYLRSGWKK